MEWKCLCFINRWLLRRDRKLLSNNLVTASVYKQFSNVLRFTKQVSVTSCTSTLSDHIFQSAHQSTLNSYVYKNPFIHLTISYYNNLIVRFISPPSNIFSLVILLVSPCFISREKYVWRVNLRLWWQNGGIYRDRGLWLKQTGKQPRLLVFSPPRFKRKISKFSACTFCCSSEFNPEDIGHGCHKIDRRTIGCTEGKFDP